MNNEKKYFAFISYKREDEKWAKWLQNKLEHYKLPSNLNGRTDLPKEIRPIFRDQSELAAGVLADEINNALTKSKYLIVICSPRAAQSEWVGKEVQTFIGLGRTDKIIPFIIGGTAHAQDPKDECFPLALLNLPPEQELLGINIDEMGRDAAAVKVVAQMFGLKFDALWQRYGKEQKRKKRLATFSIVVFSVFILCVAGWIWRQNVRLKEKDWRMMENQARMVSEKGLQILKNDSYLARLLALEVLPKDLTKPNRPYTSDAELALRTSCYHGKTILADSVISIKSLEFSKDGNQFMATVGNSINIWNTNSGKQFLSLNLKYNNSLRYASFSPDSKKVVFTTFNDVYFWDIELNKITDSLGIKTKAALYGIDNQSVICIDFDNEFGEPKNSFNVKISTWNMLDKKQVSAVEMIIPVFDFDFHFSYLKNTLYSLINEKYVCIKNNTNCIVININNGDFYSGCLDSISMSNTIIKDYGKEIPSIECSDVLLSDKGDKCVVAQGFNIYLYTLVSDVVYEYSGDVNNIALSSDGKYVLYSSEDSLIGVVEVVWEPKSIGCECFINNGVDYSTDEARSNKGDWRLSIALLDEQIPAKDGASIAKIQRATGEDCYELVIDKYHCSAFHPDGNSFAICTMGKLTIYDTKTGDSINGFPIHCITNPNGGAYFYITSVRYRPDGHVIVTSSQDGTAAIWNSVTGKCEHVLNGHSGTVNSAVFSHDGCFVVTTSSDKTIKVWSANSGNLLATIDGLSEYKYASFSPDGKRIVAASKDGTIRVWDFPPLQDLIDQTRERFKDRPLTPEERHQYYLE